MNSSNLLTVFGLGGDPLTTPENTIIGYWSALGAGASGLAFGVRQTKDGRIICSNHDTLESTCGEPKRIDQLTSDEIKKLDAGCTFRSTVLDADQQSTEKRGQDLPWLRNLPDKKKLEVASLKETIMLFGRRTSIILILPDTNIVLIDAVVKELELLGMNNKIMLMIGYEGCLYIKEKYPEISLALIGTNANEPEKMLQQAEHLNVQALFLHWEQTCILIDNKIQFKESLKESLSTSKIELLLGSDIMYFAAGKQYFDALRDIEGIKGILARGVHASMENHTPSSLIVHDNFDGNVMNQNLWTAGFSHINQDTSMEQNDGLFIYIKTGGTYSGAAAICTLPIHGRFDAQVGFRVSSPLQGTTFEMAAICIDPGYYSIDNANLNTRNVNLTFDVHGAPPYASSERDENDGFRCGWNNGFNLTKFETDWQASSVNMYNKYGRDVGDGSQENPEGILRLCRNESVFSTYYKDKHNAAWVCSGAMLVQNMAPDVYLRLAAKHWNKNNAPPPSNEIYFHDFRLYQF